ncbi:hypothetical protein Pmani_017847 [Petrolisthes manimaculis]|uniref:Uncharacterized protein n=1 Tax=Petrolisthes manimaculis TaxID=1843537 RepID=A0AAE1U5E0_9EUCA|nr:hypothetical protein Pmani_017847 [Petrolisthes manimaculis]
MFLPVAAYYYLYYTYQGKNTLHYILSLFPKSKKKRGTQKNKKKRSVIDYDWLPSGLVKQIKNSEAKSKEEVGSSNTKKNKRKGKKNKKGKKGGSK